MKCSHTTIFLFSLAVFNVDAKPQEITLWRHLANSVEVNESLAAIKRFNESQDHWKVVPDFIPEHSYTQAITAAARADVLPCVIDIDQPLVPNFAWNGFITPLNGKISHKQLADLNTSAKGIYQGNVYSVGQFDAALALFTRKSLLKKIHTRYPTLKAPWSKEEFMQTLDAIKALHEYDYPFDMRAYDKTEWITYAWSPMMISWGGDLIDRSNYLHSDGFLNSKAAVQFGNWIQKLATEGYMNPHATTDTDLSDKQVAIQLNGSWSLYYYDKALGDDLAILPLPDFGHGTVIGGGSWHWAITSTCQQQEGAEAFLSFLLSPAEMAHLSEATSLFPTSSEAAKLTKNYSEHGKWRIIYEFSKQFAQLRPATPIYSTISASYKKAMEDILNGLPPKTALDLAVDSIDTAAQGSLAGPQP